MQFCIITLVTRIVTHDAMEGKFSHSRLSCPATASVEFTHFRAAIDSHSDELALRFSHSINRSFETSFARGIYHARRESKIQNQRADPRDFANFRDGEYSVRGAANRRHGAQRAVRGRQFDVSTGRYRPIRIPGLFGGPAAFLVLANKSAISK